MIVRPNQIEMRKAVFIKKRYRQRFLQRANLKSAEISPEFMDVAITQSENSAVKEWPV